MKHKFMTLETVVFPHLIIFSFFNKTFHQKKRDAIHHKNMPYQIKQKIWCNLHIFTKNFLSLIKMLRSIHSFHKEPLLLLLPFQKKEFLTAGNTQIPAAPKQYMPRWVTQCRGAQHSSKFLLLRSLLIELLLFASSHAIPISHYYPGI